MPSKELNTKNARFDTRLPKDQKIFFERAARIGGYRNLTDFIIIAAQEKAKEIIFERERIIASEKDSQLFFDAVLDAAAPNSALTQATHDFNSLFDS